MQIGDELNGALFFEEKLLFLWRIPLFYVIIGVQINWALVIQFRESWRTYMENVIKRHFNKGIKEKIELTISRKDAWLLVLSDNEKVVFRAHSDCASAFEREKYFYETVNKKIGKVCPDVYVVDSTCEYYDKPYQITEYLDGKDLECYIEDKCNEQRKNDIYYRIGEIIAEINQVEIDLDHPYYTSRGIWEDYYAEKLYNQMRLLVKNDIVTRDEVETICANMRNRKATRTRSFLHRDIRPANMIYKDGKIFVIDAETCEFGDPLNELAFINCEWNFWDKYDILLKGYKSVVDIDINSELFYYYQLEWVGELLDMHYNHNCANKTTQHFLNIFNNCKKRILGH